MGFVGQLRLRPVRASDEAQVRAAQEELAGDDFTFALFLEDGMTWAQYLTVLGSLEQPGADRDRVPSAFLLAELDGEIVGRASVRFELNDWLAERGGHIGYGVRPAFRRRGIATEILRQSLVVARAHGVDRVLVFCLDTNTGSATAIERCGGRRDSEQPTVENHGGLLRRYWID